MVATDCVTNKSRGLGFMIPDLRGGKESRAVKVDKNKASHCSNDGGKAL